MEKQFNTQNFYTATIVVILFIYLFITLSILNNFITIF